MSNKRHSESGRKRSERRKHDQRERAYEEHTEMAWHENKTTRYVMVALVVIAIVTLTGLFVGGVIKW
jgi:hypothetical protein